jgi:heptosyltransferase-1
VIDAQGLIKSALITRLAKGVRCGLDRHSCREPLSSLAYQRKINIPRNQHAIDRVRQLFANALGYSFDETIFDYGLDRDSFLKGNSELYLVFLHGTTWNSKLYPEERWVALAQRADKEGLAVYYPWGNKAEKLRAERMAAQSNNAIVPEKMALREMAELIAGAEGIIGVDTGLTHLSAALDVPGVTLYGSTEPKLTGTKGRRHSCLQVEFDCAPCLQKECHYSQPSVVQPACYKTLPVEQIWGEISNLQSIES